jgi:hypothetical protein
MANSTKPTVRKGRIYYIRVADVEYRTFIWEAGKQFRGRVEDQPQVPQCQGSSVDIVRTQLVAGLSAILKG